MAHLNTIPTELLDGILTHVGQKELHHLTLACKSLRSCAEPLLYRSISWMWNADTPDSNPPINLLLRSILRRPQLAEYIDNLNFSAIRYRVPAQNFSKPENTVPPSEEELQLAYDLIRDAQLPSPERWRDGIASGSTDATAALLLSQLSNLQTLTLGIEFERDNDPVGEGSAERQPNLIGTMLWHTVLAPSSARISRFPILKHIRLGTDLEGRGARFHRLHFGLTQSLPLFYAPTLETAEIKIDGPLHRQQFSWPADPPSASRLTTLRLVQSRIKEDSLSHILSSTPNLKTFQYDHWPKSTGFDGTVLKNALNNVKSSLTHLAISVVPFDDQALDESDLGDQWLQRPTGSLKDFTSLRTLEISLATLLGWYADDSPKLADMLPTDLEKLRLRDDFWGFEGWAWFDAETLAVLQEFLGNWRNSTPHLRCIELHLEEADGEWNEAERARFKALCDAQTLECSVYKKADDWYDEDLRS